MRAGVGIRRFAGTAATALAAAGLLGMGAPDTALADCPLLGLPIACSQNTPPPTPPPDPGGTESPDQPVPKPGKAWGFNLGYEPDGDASPATSLQAMEAVGVTHLRYPMHWRTFNNTTTGNPVPAEMLNTNPGGAGVGAGLKQYDDAYLDLTARNITPVIIVDSVPLWASRLHRCSEPMYRMLNGEECPSNWSSGQHYPAPEYYPQWRAWVTAVARRYPRALIEGPNEPDAVWASGSPTAISPPTAADIQCEVHAAVRAVDGRDVLSVSLYDATYERGFIPRAQGCYEVFSFHTYPGATTNLGAGRRWRAPSRMCGPRVPRPATRRRSG